MGGLGGLNKSENGIVIGLVQLHLPVVDTPLQLEGQVERICAMVAKARRSMPTMDLVVFPEYALHGLSMNTDAALMSVSTTRLYNRRKNRPEDSPSFRVKC
jgi:formamidase